MSIDLFFARTWIVIAAVFIAALNFVAVWILKIGVSHWHKELHKFVRTSPKDAAPSLDSGILITSVVVMVIDVVILGGMDVGSFLSLVTENADGIAWLCGAVLVPLVTGKAVTKFTSTKYGSTDAPPVPPAP